MQFQEEKKLRSGSRFLSTLGAGEEDLSDVDLYSSDSSDEEEDNLSSTAKSKLNPALLKQQKIQSLKQQSKIMFSLFDSKPKVSVDTLHPSWQVSIRRRVAQSALEYCGTKTRFKQSATHDSGNKITKQSKTTTTAAPSGKEKIVHPSILQKRKAREQLETTAWTGKKITFGKKSTTSDESAVNSPES